jgi:hypothetical protein
MTTLAHHEAERRSVVHAGPVYNAYRILQIGFVAAPIIAGIDKFTMTMVNWDQYLAPQIAAMFGGNAHAFMMAVGVVEIIAGLGVAIKPKYFAYVVSAWLVGIIVNLMLLGAFYDIALRDLGLAMAAFALGRLAQVYDNGPLGGMLTKRSEVS